VVLTPYLKVYFQNESSSAVRLWYSCRCDVLS